MNHLRSSCAFFMLLLVVSGCYDRTNRNYDEFPYLSASQNAIVDSSGLSAEERQKRLEELEAEDRMGQPPYHINAGDVISIKVYNHPDLGVQTEVTPDGMIGMMFIGELKVSGLTLKEAAQSIEKLLEKYVKNPKVGISPQHINSQTATISGATSHPGMYTITEGMRLADLYAKAGGSDVRIFDGQNLDAADLPNSIYVRDDRILPVDFSMAIERGDKKNNILVRRGDYIYIAVRSESMVCLVGDVANPHKRLWDNNLGLIELLTTGGWLRETYWPYAIIIRGGVANPTMYKVDIDGILQGRCANVMLQAGDVVYIPKDDISEFNVFVRKVLPSGQLLNLITTPIFWWTR